VVQTGIRDGEKQRTLFKGLLGEYDVAEPVMVFMTKNNVVVMISVRYSTVVRSGTGQMLLAMEFSRKLREYKTLYPLYSTEIIRSSTQKAFVESAPYVVKIVGSIFGGQ
jgi:hypothetical protein